MDGNLYRTVLLFFVYGFLGWCVEVAFAACKHGRFVNRGFLNGPICPIYGFGVVGVVLMLRPLYGNGLLLYVASFVLTSLIELVTGYLLEKIFHAKWWDYSEMPLNIGGYVCLLFSMIWGLACMVVVKWIHPIICGLLNHLPNLLVYILDGVLLAVLLVDLFATVAAIRKLSARLRKLTELAGEIHAFSDDIGENIADRTLATRERLRSEQQKIEREYQKLEGRIEETKQQMRESREQRLDELRDRWNALISERRYAQKRLLEAFPNLKSHRNSEALESMRAFLREHHRRMQ